MKRRHRRRTRNVGRGAGLLGPRSRRADGPWPVRPPLPPDTPKQVDADDDA